MLKSERFYEQDDLKRMLKGHEISGDEMQGDYFAIGDNGKAYHATYSSSENVFFSVIPAEVKVLGYVPTKDTEEKLGVMQIEKLKSEIEELQALVNDSNTEPEKIPLIQKEIKERYMQLKSETMRLLSNADSEKLNNMDYLESINVKKINGIYIHKECTQGWTAVVTMDDIKKMEEKEKMENIKLINTDIKDSQLNLENAGTSLNLKSVSLKNCSLENVDCYLNTDEKYINQSITKKVNSEKTLMKLLSRELKKNLKLGETTMPIMDFTDKQKNG